MVDFGSLDCSRFAAIACKARCSSEVSGDAPRTRLNVLSAPLQQRPPLLGVARAADHVQQVSKIGFEAGECCAAASVR